MGADADHAPFLIDDLDVEQQLATVAHLSESSARDAPRPLTSGPYVFDAHLKPDGRLAVG